MFRAMKALRMGSMSRAPRKPLVAIVGATGTGKSDLAVELARRFDGEVINGDAMQLYQGLPIITNKITQGEMKGIPHHLLGCIGLEEETWTVGRFVSKAQSVIEDIRSRGKLPILVGGTHYYTQSLLFQDALADEPLINTHMNSQHFPILDEPTEVILQKLQEVDPVMAARWHPNERRKISRSLEIYLKTGKPASQIYSEQRAQRHDSPSSNHSKSSSKEEANGERGFTLRSPTLLFWTHAPKSILHPRLDSRILTMLSKGLLSEVETLNRFRTTHETQTGTSIDQTRGIWVSIGYKEFLTYQAALNNPSISEKELEKLRIEAVEKTQAATRQYANRQIRWIRIKLLNALTSASAKSNIFCMDTSDVSQFDSAVVGPAAQITSSFLNGNELPDPSSLSALAEEALQPKREYDLSTRPELWERKACEVCGTVTVTENDWTLHIKSRGHRRAVGVQKKKAAEELSGTHARRKKEQESGTDMLDLFEGSLEQEAPRDEPK